MTGAWLVSSILASGLLVPRHHITDCLASNARVKQSERHNHQLETISPDTHCRSVNEMLEIVHVVAQYFADFNFTGEDKGGDKEDNDRIDHRVS